MLDKLLLNNQIHANKAAVQKVRVILVNKQVHKLRKLKQINEKHPDNKKLSVKIDKCSEILVCLKKTKSNGILRQALLNAVDPKKIITNGLSTPEEVAQALFYSNNQIQSIIIQLKKILNINDADTSWREQVMEPSKRKKKQLRTEKKQKIRQERKERNELARKRNEWLVENVPVKEKVEKGALQTKETVEHAEVKANSIQSGFEEEDVTKHISKTLTETVKREKGPIKKAHKKLLPSQPVSESDTEDDKNYATVQHAVDDFFITQTGDHYLSTVVIDRYQPEQPNDGTVRKERRALQGVTQNKHKKNFKPKIGGLQTYENSAKTANSFKGRKTVNLMKSDKYGINSENLHPSWAAKQKEKGVKTFQGTKIIFDEDDIKSGKNTKSSKKELKNGVKSEAKEKLHPSWEAKQKQKPSITDFKGKKIKFDEV